MMPAPVRNERGSTVVEFALVVPALMLLLLGVMQFGIMLHANGGVRELMGWSGRRAIILYQNPTKPDDSVLKNEIAAAVGAGSYGLVASRLTTDVTVASNNVLGYRSVTITLRYSLPLSLPLMRKITVKLDQTRTYYAPY